MHGYWPWAKTVGAPRRNESARKTKINFNCICIRSNRQQDRCLVCVINYRDIGMWCIHIFCVICMHGKGFNK